MQLYRPEMQKTNKKWKKPARNAIVPAGNVKNQREMPLYQAEMRKTSEECKKPARNATRRGRFHFWDRFPKEYREIAEKEACEAFLQGKERAFRVFPGVSGCLWLCA